MANELSLRELESEMAIELPEREALTTVHFRIHINSEPVNVNSAGASTSTSVSFSVINVQIRDIYLVSGS